MKEFTYKFIDGLASGLRPHAQNPRNNPAMVVCQGAVPEHNVMHALEDLSSYRVDFSSIDSEVDPIVFPFPQLFVLKSIVLVCLKDAIYSLNAGTGSLTLEISTPTGTTWTVADYGLYIAMTNGACNVIRDPQTGAFTLSEQIPPCTAICDVNGQLVIVGLLQNPTPVEEVQLC